MAASARTHKTYERILDEAAALFATRGYKRTRVQDVAEAVGVSEPAVYRYFRGKDALFDAVLRRAAGATRADQPPASLPISNPEAGATLAFLSEFFGRSRRLQRVEAAMAGAGDALGMRAELAGVLEEVFDLATRYRVGARIMRASAIEAPELGAVFERELLTPLMTSVQAYLSRHAAAGRLRVPGELGAVAAILLNLVGVHAAYPELLVPVGDGLDGTTRAAVVTAALAMFEPTGGYR